MKLVFLATLDAILRCGSFTAAAEEMGLTPSAVSLQVKRLEEHFGQPLFVRAGRVAKPTQVARELAEAMQGALSTMEALRLRSTPAVEGRVSIGTIRTVQSSTLPAALHEVHRLYPKLTVRAVQGETSSLLEQLKSGALDAAVVIRPASGGARRFQWHPLAHEPFVLIAPPATPAGQPLAEILREHDFIHFDKALVSGRLAAACLHKLAHRVRSSAEIDSIDTIVALVSAGFGVSVVPKPRHPISRIHPVREFPLEQGRQSREIAFVSRELDADNRRVRALREAFGVAYATDGPSAA
jgi:DNA-binding transcriptional LysR family regulator